MTATRKQVDANRRNGHLRRAARQYATAAAFIVKAREWRKAGYPATAADFARLARSTGKSARHALAMAAKYEGR